MEKMTKLTLTQTREALVRGRVSARELTQAWLDAMEAKEGDIGAFITRCPDRALAEADMLMIGGTSLNVYPAAGLIRYYQGHRLVLLNKSPVARDLAADLVITDPIGETLAQL